MKLLQYITVLASLVVLSACSEECVGTVGAGDGETAETFTISASVAVPELKQSLGRALTDTPDYGDLKLYLLEFDNNGTPLSNFITAVYTPSRETPQDGYVTFDVTLNKVVTPKVLHLIAVPKSVDLNPSTFSGSEGTILPRLVVSDEVGAYWRRLEFDNYGSFGGADNTEWTTNPDLKSTLTMVPLIRNFSRVSISNNATGFQLLGYAVFNVPTSGTIAPWDGGNGVFPEFMDGNNLKEYDAIDYDGILPADYDLKNIGINPEGTDIEDGTAPKYFYERPFSSVNHAMVVIKGRYGNEAVSYYKIDLGQIATSGSNQGVFSYYDLLRNFDYHININRVGTSGYSTYQLALNGVVYNNFSFDVSTNHLLNISNGTDMIWVNKNTIVVNKDTQTDRTVRFGVKYSKNINTSSPANGNDDVKIIKGSNWDEVVDSWTESAPVKGEDATYKYYEIVTKAPNASGETLQTDFIVINPETGLGRTVNIIVRKPWEITRVYEFAGNYNTPNQFPVAPRPGNNCQNLADDGEKAPITVFFVIPNDLPEAIFPVRFELEADRQNIENNPIGTLVVESGPSLFNPLETRMKYVKTVTWTDYNTVLDNINFTGTIVDDVHVDGTVVPGKIHRVRCRFRTITSLENLGVAIGGSTTTNVRIHNDYFTDAEGGDPTVSFVRTRGSELDAPDYKGGEDPSN